MGLFGALFGPSKKQVWHQLCDEIGATYVSGGFWRGDKVLITVSNWTVTLDTYTESHSAGEHHNSTTYTRMRVPYIAQGGFQFKIYRKGIFSSLGKFFGRQQIEIGDPQLDDAFVFQANDEERLRNLLADDTIRQLIAAQPRMLLEVRDNEGWLKKKLPAHVDELYFSAVGVIKDVERLKLLCGLFGHLLLKLAEAGSASEADPKVVL